MLTAIEDIMIQLRSLNCASSDCRYCPFRVHDIDFGIIHLCNPDEQKLVAERIMKEAIDDVNS